MANINLVHINFIAERSPINPIVKLHRCMQDRNPAAHGQKSIYKKYRTMVHFRRYNKMPMIGYWIVLQGFVYKDKTIAFEAFELHLKNFL